MGLEDASDKGGEYATRICSQDFDNGIKYYKKTLYNLLRDAFEAGACWLHEGNVSKADENTGGEG